MDRLAKTSWLAAGLALAAAFLPAPFGALSAIPLLIAAFLQPLAGLAALAVLLPFSPVLAIVAGWQFQLAELAAISIVAGSLVKVAVSRPGLQALKPNLFDLAALALLAGSLLSFIAVESFDTALRAWRWTIVEPLAIYLVARYTIRSRADIRLLLWSLAAGAVLISIFGLIHYLFNVNIITADDVRRIRVFYGSPNNLSLILGRLLPILVALAVFQRSYSSSQERSLIRRDGERIPGLLAGPHPLNPPLPPVGEGDKELGGHPLEPPPEVASGDLRGYPDQLQRSFRIWPVVGWITVAVVAGAIALTFSIGGWIAASVAVIITVWLLGLRRQAGFLIVAAALFGALLVVAGPGQRVTSHLSSEDGTTALRIYLWQSSLRMALDHPILGVGPDNFIRQYQSYRLPAAWQEPDLSHPHNALLDFWLNAGLFGLAALALLIVGWIIHLHHVLKRADRERRVYAAGLAGAGAYALLHGLIDNSYFLIDLALWTWLASAILGKLPYLEET